MPPRPRCTVVPDLRHLLRSIASLSADPANTRVHPEANLRAIEASLRRYGQQKPIVVDASGVVIAGSGTLEAARRLGWTHLAAVRSRLSDIERVGYSIADNRAGELAGWDETALAASLARLGDEDLAASGFTRDDLARLQAPGQDPKGPTADLPAVVHPDPVTRAGDLWHLGEHRLLCGDSTDAACVDRVMEKDRAALVATDPPYLVDYTGKRAGGTGKDWSEVYHEVEVGDASAFFLALFTQVVRVMADGAAVYCWHAHRRAAELVAAWRSVGLLDHQQLIWVKPTPVFGSVFYHFRHEPCLMGWRQGHKPQHDGRHGEDSVWAEGAPDLDTLPRSELVRLLKESSTVWEVSWEGRCRPEKNEHPTQKPIELFARPMRKHTRPGDVCFEPFSGSGSQLIAAEQLGRRCRSIELEPVFVDVAVRRWQALTGQAAMLAGKKTWAAVAKSRGVALERGAAPRDRAGTKKASRRAS